VIDGLEYQPARTLCFGGSLLCPVWSRDLSHTHPHILNLSLPHPSPAGSQATFMQSLQAFYGAIVLGRKRPTFSWDISKDGKTIAAHNSTVMPARVMVWQSTTTDGFRDWRLFSCRTSQYGVFHGAGMTQQFLTRHSIGTQSHLDVFAPICILRKLHQLRGRPKRGSSARVSGRSPLARTQF